VRKGAFIAGLGMLLIGGYMFLISMIMITDLSFVLDWATWTIYLTVGIVLFSIGPGVMLWAYRGNYQALYGKTQWQVIRISQTALNAANL
jgi:hypothetical protein